MINMRTKLLSLLLMALYACGGDNGNDNNEPVISSDGKSSSSAFDSSSSLGGNSSSSTNGASSNSSSSEGASSSSDNSSSSANGSSSGNSSSSSSSSGNSSGGNSSSSNDNGHRWPEGTDFAFDYDWPNNGGVAADGYVELSWDNKYEGFLKSQLGNETRTSNRTDNCQDYDAVPTEVFNGTITDKWRQVVFVNNASNNTSAIQNFQNNLTDKSQEYRLDKMDSVAAAFDASGRAIVERWGIVFEGANGMEHQRWVYDPADFDKLNKGAQISTFACVKAGLVTASNRQFKLPLASIQPKVNVH